ncbi:MAG: DUF86 domain-containing protein [Candidatus Aenigmarchaeota archaeon]|nr:DUF86 domain-containing protein [Candidatus Aenigmarchaeota archaeon]MCK5333031.1 DUF86 domain-containing protein [Candidatus Aenigmarchaeota archaeon]
MIDKERILDTLRELDGFLEELDAAMPETMEEYLASSEKRRVCERLLQLSIECVVDASISLVRGLRLGTISDEENAFTKLEAKKVLSKSLSKRLKDMKGFRNVLVHRYAQLENERVYDLLENNLNDFENFKEAVLKAVKSPS